MHGIYVIQSIHVLCIQLPKRPPTNLACVLYIKPYRSLRGSEFFFVFSLVHWWNEMMGLDGLGWVGMDWLYWWGGWVCFVLVLWYDRGCTNMCEGLVISSLEKRILFLLCRINDNLFCWFLFVGLPKFLYCMETMCRTLWSY